ncbi:hypothetical protein E2C01_027739 [Portunus trituberculatus]|uniref:Uncharacterized protein n=1 Tax=Portunus trituberculatus TaxID=210409 RepID=A0A5B7EPN4_PORTR|nr:hypothetical protein [Portunus trituberculatus]
MVAPRHFRILVILAAFVTIYLKVITLLTNNNNNNNNNNNQYNNNQQHTTKKYPTHNKKNHSHHHHYHHYHHHHHNNNNKQIHIHHYTDTHNRNHHHNQSTLQSHLAGRGRQKAAAATEGEAESMGVGHLGVLVVEAAVGAAGLEVRVDGVKVFHILNQTESIQGQVVRFHAGLHLVTLDERSGAVMRSQTFLTWQPESSRQVAQALRDAGEGRLLLLVGLVSAESPGAFQSLKSCNTPIISSQAMAIDRLIADQKGLMVGGKLDKEKNVPEFTMYLGHKVTRQLASFGSVFAERLAKDEAWCMAAWKGKGVAGEGLTIIPHSHGSPSRQASPVSLRLIIPRRRREWRHDAETASPPQCVAM